MTEQSSTPLQPDASPPAAANTVKPHNCVVVEVGGPTDDPEIRVKSFPLYDPNQHCLVPLYHINVYKAYRNPNQRYPERASYFDQKRFKLIRFAWYWNDGSVKEYKSIGNFVVGLKDHNWHLMPRYMDYELHSVDFGSNGAWVIKGTHYIHDGPDDHEEIFGSAGCMEVYGYNAFTEFSNTLVDYTGARNRYEAPKKMPIFINLLATPRPPKKLVPQE